jgi:hypothetical protein
MAAGGSLDADTAHLSRLGFSVRLPRTVEVLEEDNKCVDAVAPYEQAFADWVDAWRQTLMPHQHSLLVPWLAGDPQLRRELLAGATPASWARTDDAVVRTFAEPEANLALAIEIVALPLVERQRRLAERRLAGHRIAWLRAGSDDDARVHVAVARYQTTRPLTLDEFYRAVKRDSAGRVYVFGDPLNKNDLTGQSGCTVTIDSNPKHRGNVYWGAVGGTGGLGAGYGGVRTGYALFKGPGAMGWRGTGSASGVGGFLGDFMVQYITTGKYNWCEGLIVGVGGFIIGALFF